jgi:maltokinase
MVSLADELPGLLLSWIPQQSWFAGGSDISLIRVAHSVPLLEGEPTLDLVIVSVEHADAEDRDYFQLLLARRHTPPAELLDAAVGLLGDCVVYDALSDHEISEWLLRELAKDSSSHEGVRFVREANALVPKASVSHVLTENRGETSIAFGEELVLKWFRQARPGNAVDLDLHRALRRAGSDHVAALRASIQADWESGVLTLALLRDALQNPAECWDLALVSLRDLLAERDLRASEVGGDFAGEAFRLGAALADVHADLAGELETGDQSLTSEADAMIARLSAAEHVLPRLAGYGPEIRATYDRLAGSDMVSPTQRVHGGLTFHNILRVPPGWLFVDFGGDLARPLIDVARPASVLRDVADVMRSFDTVAHSQLLDWSRGSRSDSQLEWRAAEWSDRNRSAFCDGYASVAQRDPREVPAVLLAYELDRAVSDSVNSARSRPDVLQASLDSVQRLTSYDEHLRWLRW